MTRANMAECVPIAAMRAIRASALTLAATLTVASQARAAEVAQIPLVPGLVVVGVVVEPAGDREPMLTIQSVGADYYDALYTDEVIDSSTSKKRSIAVQRRVRMKDHRGAHAIQSEFWEGDPRMFAGTTPFLSRAIIEDLRRGSSTITSHYSESFFGLPMPSQGRGTLRRVAYEKATVLVNGRPRELRVIHARGTLQGDNGNAPDPVDVLALDDLENPLFLRWKDSKSDARIVRIDYPEASAARSRLEAALARKETVDLYSVYFAFASADLRPQSQRTLADIAAVLARHGDWKLQIRGHTDDVGADAANLQLSKRRANAVRESLIADHHIAPQRLAADGFGESGAVATNKTPEGRARNRRVTLSRL